MTTKRAEVLLGSGNYFHWEFNMRMTLARKGLLEHVLVIKPENEITEGWLMNDAKALGIIAQGVELQHQTKIRSATRAMEAWGTLRDFYNRSTLHNRVTMTRRLHEFKMEDGSTMSKHLDAFDELVVGLQALGEPVVESRQLVVLLSSLPAEYELIASIVENAKGITLIEVKEKLLKEYERLEKKETTERAFKANAGRFKGGRGNGRKVNGPRKNGGGFKGKCFKCNQVGHLKRDCPERNGTEEDGAVFAVGERHDDGWLIDSGATSHMTPHRVDLFDYEELRAGPEGRRIKMVDVIYIPGLDRRLLSVGKLAERGMNVEFQRSSCVIWGKSSAIALGKKYGKAYVLDCQQEEARFAEYAGADSEWELWHARLGHPGKNGLVRTQRATYGMPVVKQETEKLCGGCLKGKQTVAPFPQRSLKKTSRVLELIHTDVMGPMRTVSKGGARWILTFVDDYSRFVVVYFMKNKSEVASKLNEFKAFYENQWGEQLRCLRSDNGTEFINKKMARICAKNGIMHQRTVPYSPQQNGGEERMNRTIMEKARSMLYYKGVSTEWWAEAVSTAVYLINRSTNTANTIATPYELGFKEKPRMGHLRVFGSHGYAHVDDAKRTKLVPKSFRCMFLGYAEYVKGYRVFDLECSKVKVARSVRLDEREVNGIYDTNTPERGTVIHVTKDSDAGTISVHKSRQPVEDEPMEAVEEPGIDVDMEEAVPEQEGSFPELPPSPEPLTSGLKLTTRPAEPVFLLEDSLELDDEQRSEDSNGPPSPKRPRIDEDGLIAEAVLAYAASIVEAADPPTTYAQAMAGDDAAHWREALDAELLSHERNGTWTLVPRGTDIRPIGCRWVFAKKRDENGRVVRYKARLVAKGFKQKFGIDFFETYSPVANMNSIRVVLGVSVADGYILEQLDADTAFLDSELNDWVYMEVPFGIENARDYVCKLNEAIYGLKQVASAWNKTIHRVFLKNGFKSCGADQCVYVKRSRNGHVYVCLYVDMIIAAKSTQEIREVKDALKAAFKMKDLGTAKFILGMEIDHDKGDGTLMIKQTRYIDDVAERFGQQNAKPVENPCISGLKLSKAQSPGTVVERAEMRSKPCQDFWRTLDYNIGEQLFECYDTVKSTRDHGIIYERGSGNVTVEAYTDADWGSNLDDRRSVSGVMVMIGNGPVVFKSKFQRTVALSSAEAEYMALSLCTQEVLWTRAMLADLRKEQAAATQIWEDNQGAIALACNAGYHARTKHVDIRHHFVRENVERGTVKVDYIDTKY
ncbi:unnamed protein product [Phytophthora lilii]|uniref:Unnamed protein product n=1 Tax=Phytophthora lilii TaxID=2077276 RepID=A0A9W6WKE9_9STRA|nr:unnamed protein product [Phytophthora lilii]